jgi:hypothetical protein
VFARPETPARRPEVSGLDNIAIIENLGGISPTCFDMWVGAMEAEVQEKVFTHTKPWSTPLYRPLSIDLFTFLEGSLITKSFT